MDVETCWKWFNEVFFPKVENRTGCRVLLLMDNALGHIEAFKRDNIRDEVEDEESDELEELPNMNCHPKGPISRKASQTSVYLQEWDIPFEQLELGELIGKGRWGKVHKGRWHGEVAIRLLEIDGNNQDHLKLFKKEVMNYRQTRHENVVLFMGACMHPPHLAIITSFCKGRTLCSIVRDTKNALDINKTRQIAQEIVKGMGYLHAKGIVHKDLKSRNVFYDNNKVVITDFGLFGISGVVQEGRRENQLKLPHGWLCYLAPEIVREMAPGRDEDQLPFSKAADVYAFGTVWYELQARDWPFKNQPAEAIIWQVGSGEGIKNVLAQASLGKEVTLIGDITDGVGFKSSQKPYGSMEWNPHRHSPVVEFTTQHGPIWMTNTGSENQEGTLRVCLLIDLPSPSLCHSHWFDINFKCGPDIAFHFNPRYEGSQKYVVCNTQQHHSWGSEERKYEAFVQEGSMFTMTIQVNQDSYMVLRNGSYFLHYMHRLPFSRVDNFSVNGDVQITSIAFQNAVNRHRIVHLNNGSTFNEMNTRFHINLRFHSGIALHLNPRFNENAVVRNSFLNESWGPEERHLAMMPLMRGQSFTILIQCESSRFNIVLNGKHAITFNHRVSQLQDIDVLEIDGDVSLTWVQV
ncbi:KSR1 Kinase, partial [Polypterus senegalus]